MQNHASREASAWPLMKRKRCIDTPRADTPRSYQRKEQRQAPTAKRSRNRRDGLGRNLRLTASLGRSDVSMPATAASEATFLGRLPLAPPVAPPQLIRRGAVRLLFRRHGAADFERLVEIVGEPGCPVATILEVEALLAGQAPQRDAESAQFRDDDFQSGDGPVVGHPDLLAPAPLVVNHDRSQRIPVCGRIL
jgi:hypothetical protein